MPTHSFDLRRGQLQDYFDRTAVEAWKRLTSDAPVSGIRATVRAGRNRMRATLLDWLPDDLRGARLLDAGCGTGALAVEAARRGARVVAIDLSPTLVGLAGERTPGDLGDGSIHYTVGDMTDPALGCFDYVMAMDSLIHYRAADTVRALSRLATRTGIAIVFTHAPKTVPLTLMHAVGRLFPKSDRAPAIEPVARKTLHRLIAREPGLEGWQPGRSARITSGFYMSQARELVPAGS